MAIKKRSINTLCEDFSPVLEDNYLKREVERKRILFIEAHKMYIEARKNLLRSHENFRKTKKNKKM